MQKEIAEQPVAVAQTLAAGFDSDGELNIAAFGEKASSILPKIKHIRIVACGTSFHAGLLAKYWLEQYAHIACEVEVASEFRYRQSVSQPDSLLIIISQSGETADSLAALRQAKPHYAASLAICNVPTSSLVRETDLVFLTRAGIELGVASTKAFTTQLTALLLLTFNLAKLRNTLNAATLQSLIAEFRTAPVLLQQALDLEPQIQNLAKRFRHKQHALYLGRGVYYPLALEGALKLKEISYIHAEAYPAGELKHGPLALVDEHMPIVAMVPNNGLFEKMHGNLQEVKARGGELLMITETALIEKLGLPGDVLSLPHVPDIIGPLVYCVPLQLLSYHVALCKGTDVDQPRNLAKSVTVE
jgi:glucosamine--fructose-6-phosphate aminotransferase (isomerizing)